MKDRQVDLSVFTHGANSITLKSLLESFWSYRQREISHTYTLEEAKNIVESSSLQAKQRLSRNFFNKNGIYKRIILFYATLLKYAGIVIPHPSFGKKLSTPHIQKRYFNAVAYINKIQTQKRFPQIVKSALVNGCYYGVIKDATKKDFNLIDLPIDYCRSRFKNIDGTDMIEFNVDYFNTIVDENIKLNVLNAYPQVIVDYYTNYRQNIGNYSKWMIIPSEIAACFSFFENGVPLFLDIIPDIMEYRNDIQIDREKSIEEIRKIIVQKVPHLQDGQLLFEPDEALEMHKGAVSMMSQNKNVSVLTTYTDVDAVVSNSSSENTSTNSVERSKQNIYTNTGMSAQILSATGTQAIELSIKNDKALMMTMAEKLALFVTKIINQLFGNSNVTFNYLILPVTYYDQSEYITDSLKLAQSGYSFLLPAIALGTDQQQILDLKDLENDILKLDEKFIPLSSSFTQSNNQPGAPKKDLENKSDKTIQNEESLDRQGQQKQTQGGSNNG